MENGVRKKMPKRKSRRDFRKKLGEPDVSGILKVLQTDQAEEPDELFGEPSQEPLHSTAVSAYEEEDQHSDGSTSSSSDSEPKKKDTRGSKCQHILKSRSEREVSEEEPVQENMMPIRSAECHKKQKEACSPEMATDYSDSDAEPDLIKVWGSKDLKKAASRVKETDVILDAFEKITAKYKQGVELKICRKAIDSFSIAFREQLTNNVAGAEELRTTKLKNAKMVRATNKKRQRLTEVKGELLKTEPQLKKLEREYAELKGELSTLRNAVQLVTDLKDLKQKYVNVRKENPQEKTVYGASSLPALLVESRRILGAESHVRRINSKLQQVLDSQTED
ncbi:Uncharacterized protein PODLI_1B011465 [Podarcis lilfordi]|uniref:Centromere protein U n=1 Tax=Podarcis lilfordi TaxID=74358 RepID=A0AA35KTF6_9SAUR|nr:Uncharacterized protein PODLI_1B011465 [Podarcis lilfordi]